MTLRQRPAAVWAVPLAALAVGLFLLATDAGGLASGARSLFFNSLARVAPTHVDTGLFPKPAELVVTAFVGLGLVALLASLGVTWSVGAAIVVLGVVFFLSWFLYLSNRVFFDASGPVAITLLVVAAGSIERIFEITRARLGVRNSRANTPPSIERIARSPRRLNLDGETRTVTCLSCGIRGFASLASSLKDDPVLFTRLVKRMLTPLMDECLTHSGTIDRLTTDGFTAFWNAPLDDPAHATHACQAANHMTERMAQMNEQIMQERRNDGPALQPIEIGIGIATGPAIAGGFSAHGRTVYSVTGECAFVAARLQALSQQYGPAVIVAETTRKTSEGGFAFLEVDYIAGGAQEEPIKLYAMLGNPVVRASPKFRALATFHEHIFQSLRTQQWQKSRELIEQCRKLSGASQKVYDLHLARIGYFEANPPGEDWDGAFRPILH